MATLLKPREEVEKAIAACLRAGEVLNNKATTAESTGRYEDWLVILAKWREETAAQLTTLYEEGDIGRDFTVVTDSAASPHPPTDFGFRKFRLGVGLSWLGDLIAGLELAVEKNLVSSVPATTQHAQVAAEPSDEPFSSTPGPVPKPDVVVVTVNEHETQAIHEAFQAATGIAAVPVPLDGRVYHNLGTLNGTTVFHAISEMGSGGPGAMQQAVDKAIRALDPGAVIAVGIAFGVSEDHQSIGDILLSKQLRLYDLQRAGAEIVLRGDKPHASTRLINHFESFTHTKWKGARVRPGVILSGERLIDNIDYRDQLLTLEREAVGGDMEGAGLYVSCHEHKVDWIVIKAICDWADGNKGVDKTARQKLAAKNAVQFLIQALQYAPLKHQK
jgi:nucleoside phosphorylase